MKINPQIKRIRKARRREIAIERKKREILREIFGGWNIYALHLNYVLDHAPFRVLKLKSGVMEVKIWKNNMYTQQDWLQP